MKRGLAVNPRTMNQLAWGVQRKGSPFNYVRPDIMRAPHDSMSTVWRLFEYLPKVDKYKKWTTRKSFFGHYIPASEPRFIPPGAFVHQSVVDRMAAVANYRPENFPERPEVVPMSAGWADGAGYG